MDNRTPLQLPGLSGKRAIVTGHRGGIGQALTRLLEEHGVRVYGLDLPEVDFVKYHRLSEAVAKAHGVLGGVDFLFNNAGFSNLGSVEDTPLEELEKVMAINFYAPFALIQSVIPLMRAQGGGCIVNNTSDMALVGKRFAAAYASSKAALAALTKSAAIDFATENIRVNAVAPGGTRTPMLDEAIKGLALRYPARYAGADESFYASGNPMERLANPAEIAWVMVFLASDAASFMNGAIVPVDGGFTAT